MKVVDKSATKRKKPAEAEPPSKKANKEAAKELSCVMIPVHICALCQNVYAKSKLAKTHVAEDHNISVDRAKDHINKEMRKAVISADPNNTADQRPPGCSKCASDAADLNEIQRMAQKMKETFNAVTESVDKFIADAHGDTH